MNNLLNEMLEKIAASWDGCMCDAPGEAVDVGADLRRAFAKVCESAAFNSAQQVTNIAPSTAPVSGDLASIDTPEFQEMAAEWFNHDDAETAFSGPHWQRMVAHIDGKARTAVAAAKAPACHHVASATGELPALPRAWHSYQTSSDSEFAATWASAYTADQMRGYAKLAIESGVAPSAVEKLNAARLQCLIDHSHNGQFELISQKWHLTDPRGRSAGSGATKIDAIDEALARTAKLRLY